MASAPYQVAFDLMIDCHDWMRLCHRPDELMRGLQSPNVESIWPRRDRVPSDQDVKGEFLIARNQINGAIIRK
jgi:hypothetical protein